MHGLINRTVCSSRLYIRSFSSSTPRLNVRVRFAPSPTGFLHLGSIRTALCNYLFAKKNAGLFILRIEDTDQTRIVDGGIEGIERELKWTGLNPDEGPTAGGPVGPYIQSQRKHLYQEKAQQLLDSGHAYRCFCSQTLIDLIRKEAARNQEVPRYDNRCRHLSEKEIGQKLQAKEPFVVRLKLTDGPISFNDIVTGDECMDLSKVESDPIIMKSDGFPTYHLANVVDDHLMQISHVLRGIEWQQSTPKHLMIFNALGYTPPVYGHLPLILNADGTKLSKRVADIRLDEMREQGYFPETIVNYLARMGRAVDLPEDDDRIYSVSELADRFSSGRLQPRANRYDFNLMKALNRKCFSHFLLTDRPAIRHKVRQMLRDKIGKQDMELRDEFVDHVLDWSQDRIFFLPDLVNEFAFVWHKPTLDFDLKSLHPSIGSPGSTLASAIQHLRDKDTDLSSLKTFCSDHGIKYGPFCGFLRSCLTNKREGPPLGEILQILGPDQFHDYLSHALNYCRQSEERH